MRHPLSIFVGLLASSTLVWADAGGSDHKHGPATPTIKAEVVAPASFTAGQRAATVLRLTGADGKPVTFDQLQVTHTEKLHLLIVNETLGDYHHEHPVPAEKPGEYRFDFTPRFGGSYHIWADVVPTATGQQEYVKTQVKVQGTAASANRALNTDAEGGALRFSFATEDSAPLEVGKASIVRVQVTTPDGKDFAGLEPVMGAFAHMVAFPEDVGSVMHVHPMGREPEQPTERGGPELKFHVVPEMAGLHRFFVQTQLKGKPIYVSFAQNVESAKASATSKKASAYSCPMHPEVVSEKPGSCPKCGMPLTAKK